MLDWNLFTKLFLPEYPPFPNARVAPYDQLLADALTMGTLYIGRQGTGKTTALARHTVDYFKTFPDRAIFVLDWSGSITDSILGIIANEPPRVSDALTARLVYDELGHPDWVKALPEFSNIYGNPPEEQA